MFLAVNIIVPQMSSLIVSSAMNRQNLSTIRSFTSMRINHTSPSSSSCPVINFHPGGGGTVAQATELLTPQETEFHETDCSVGKLMMIFQKARQWRMLRYSPSQRFSASSIENIGSNVRPVVSKLWRPDDGCPVRLLSSFVNILLRN